MRSPLAKQIVRRRHQGGSGRHDGAWCEADPLPHRRTMPHGAAQKVMCRIFEHTGCCLGANGVAEAEVERGHAPCQKTVAPEHAHLVARPSTHARSWKQRAVPKVSVGSNPRPLPHHGGDYGRVLIDRGAILKH